MRVRVLSHPLVQVGGRVTVGFLDLSGTLNGLDPRTDYLRLDRTLQHTGKHFFFLFFFNFVLFNFFFI